MRIHVVREVGAPASTVWAILVDVPGSEDVIGSIERIELLAGSPRVEVGTRWRETRSMHGRRSTMELTVSAVDEGRSYTITAQAPGAELTSTISVEPASGGSLLAITVDSRGTSRLGGVMAATVGRAFEGAARSALAQDLTDLALAAEARAGADGSESGGRPTPP